MYGLILEGIHFMVEHHWSEATWLECLDQAGITNPDFSTHERYSERMAPAILVALSEMSGIAFEDIGILAGKYFVHFCCTYGYGELLRVMGRRFSDFLKGMDNLHEYFRFSYDRFKPPSFYCDKEDKDGLVLHYRSRREGYISYVMGQLIEIAKLFYNCDIEINLMKKEQRKGVTFSIFRINFDNSNYRDTLNLTKQLRTFTDFLPVDSASFLNLFPFYIVYNKKLEVQLAGKAILKIMPNIIGKKLDDQFELIRPFIKFTYEGIRMHIWNIFKVESKIDIRKPSTGEIAFKINEVLEDKFSVTQPEDAEEITQEDANDMITQMYKLRLKGQMLYIRKSEMLVYLATAEVDTLMQMFDIGLYMNDYSISDCNRDIIMASIQKSDSLKELLKGEQEKSKFIIKSMRETDDAKKLTKALLEEMMPKSVARSLMRGEDVGSIVQTFEEATICFTKIYDFGTLQTTLPAMAIVTLLNRVFSLFDEIIEKHGVYKVETIGESYMVSCGVPVPTENHAEYIADTGLEMLARLSDFKEETSSRRIKIKLGMNSGPVVGGVVGNKTPRYCLFGDTVNSSSRMESFNDKPMTIMTTNKTKECLESKAETPNLWVIVERAMIEVKGKGIMQTYELSSKNGDARAELEPLFHVEEDLDANEDDAYTHVEDMSTRASGSISRMSVGGRSILSSRSQGTDTSHTNYDEDGGHKTPSDAKKKELQALIEDVHVLSTRSSNDTITLQVNSVSIEKRQHDDSAVAALKPGTEKNVQKDATKAEKPKPDQNGGPGLSNGLLNLTPLEDEPNPKAAVNQSKNVISLPTASTTEHSGDFKPKQDATKDQLVTNDDEVTDRELVEQVNDSEVYPEIYKSETPDSSRMSSIIIPDERQLNPPTKNTSLHAANAPMDPQAEIKEIKRINGDSGDPPQLQKNGSFDAKIKALPPIRQQNTSSNSTGSEAGTEDDVMLDETITYRVESVANGVVDQFKEIGSCTCKLVVKVDENGRPRTDICMLL